jgi:hypothetical protein
VTLTGALGGILSIGLAAGCTASAEDVRPPRDQLAFPTGMAITPDEKTLFVANANSELRYDSGSIGVLDLDRVRSVVNTWANGAIPTDYDCKQDIDHSETLGCEEANFFRADSGVRIGNFATDLTVQDFTASDGSGNVRVFVPTRGDPSVAWADFDGDRLHCTSGSDSYPLCDDAHRLTSLENNPDLAPLAGEPFTVFAHTTPAGVGAKPTEGFAIVGHLFSASVTLIDAPADSSRVRIVDMIHNVFGIDGTGERAASSIAGLALPDSGLSTTPEELIYIASSTEDRVQTFTVGELEGSASYLLPNNFFFLNAVGNNAGNSANSRSIAFSSRRDRLYLVNRLPPSLQVYDTSIGPTGMPINQPLGSSDTCREASAISVANFGDVIGDRIYVTCFQDGQVYIVDPTGQSRVEDIVSVGRGPYAAVVIPDRANMGKQPLLLVSNFLEDTIAVIDLSLDSAKRNRVVLRIGTPRGR